MEEETDVEAIVTFMDKRHEGEAHLHYNALQ